MFQRFVVRSNSKEGRPLRQMDFHLVDLEEGSISMNYIPSITNGVGNGFMVNLFDNIFVLGGVYDYEDEANKLEGHHFHLGASRYSAINSNWKSISLPETRTIPNPAAMSGKLYCFGSLYLCPEIFEFGCTWKKLELPSELQGRILSGPVITDREKSRIIVHMPELDELYAFCPPEDYFTRGGSTGGTWSRIATGLGSWCKVVGVVDDLICFHEWDYENLLQVFDLRSKKWLKVVADLSLVKITVREFDRLFTVSGGNGLMCLASWVPVRPVSTEDPPSVHFLRFYLKRSSNASVINLEAVDYQFHPIPTAGSVSDFVMLQYG